MLVKFSSLNHIQIRIYGGVGRLKKSYFAFIFTYGDELYIYRSLHSKHTLNIQLPSLYEFIFENAINSKIIKDKLFFSIPIRLMCACKVLRI